MIPISEAKKALRESKARQLFQTLYQDRAEAALCRYDAAIDAFAERFGTDRPIAIFSAPGRTEIGGNHTDHNLGRVLAASVDADVIAVVAKTEGDVIEIHSEGFGVDRIRIGEMTPRADEIGRSAALIRGVASEFCTRGFAIGPFCAYTESQVPKGSGVSSSAAFEVLIASIFNSLFASDSLSMIEMAKLSQKVEREWFKKPCGLMDQAACAVGGICMMDFADESDPEITPIPFSFETSGYKLCLVSVGGDHADLTDLYAAIPQRMHRVAELFGEKNLRPIPTKTFFERLPQVRRECGDDAALAAIHFFGENERVPRQAEALRKGDFKAFCSLVCASGHSSYEALQNVLIPLPDALQGAGIALNLAARLLEDRGAWRIHGGGFGGTTQNFVPDDRVDAFCEAMEAIFGQGACRVFSIRPVGPVRIL